MKKISLSFFVKNGFLHIFSANVINKIIQFCSSIILIRFISKGQYGQYSYAGNILSIFLLFEGLGVSSGLLQYSSENRNYEQKLGYLKLSIKYGSSFDFFIGILVFTFSLFFTLPVSGAVEILRWMFLIPFFSFFFNIIETFLRGNLRNFHFSILSVLNTVLYLLFSIAGVIIYDIWGVLIGRYIAFIITDLIGFCFIYKDVQKLKKIPCPEKIQKKEFLKYSMTCMLCNSISSFLYLIDTFLIGIIIKDSNIVAGYKTATLIPFALNFIPGSIMTFLYPYFAKINDDVNKIKSYYKTLVQYIGILNLCISIILFICAPWIIILIFGSNYKDSIIPFRILSIGYFFAGTFRIPAGNILGSIRKVNVNLLNSIISGILNVILDILFILLWGSTGASISTASIYIVSAFISNGYLIYYLNKKERNKNE